jgi:hypothetical protein
MFKNIKLFKMLGVEQFRYPQYNRKELIKDE